MAQDSNGTTEQAHRAGAFDVRNFIAMLIGIFGVVLVITSFFDGESELAKADGVRVNLWAGLGMVVVALVFFAWARLRPVVVPEDTAAGDADGRAH
ncbi:hypothetical protein SAMN04488570_0400 [Nocardioides scoriae]|uniref:Uncharacterized protein n=1 Tax=Nocardioides scoriae TaxID=642780 RepID=A0A1H1LYZ9_9ACTN|nr:hypothetical protein [Nocardioides scoriae]SDR79275.1 hypothetical protein SAMN04488570_0400 [Nocardioides scoriae]